jgi:selenocysteine lyase/cysteine desulfurase
VTLAGDLARRLEERGVTVALRDSSTLVSFEVPEPEAFAQRASDEGIVIRHLPGRPWARASVGAWNTEDELERLAELASRQ